MASVLSVRTMMRIVSCLLLFGISSWATAAEETVARARYIANMGAMVERGDTKVLFDPLFHNDFGTYDSVPVEIETALLAGTQPWDGIDAVFVSHYHEDHFDPATILKLLRTQSTIEFFAPEQAAEAIRVLVAEGEDSLLDFVDFFDVRVCLVWTVFFAVARFSVKTKTSHAFTNAFGVFFSPIPMTKMPDSRIRVARRV